MGTPTPGPPLVWGMKTVNSANELTVGKRMSENSCVVPAFFWSCFIIWYNTATFWKMQETWMHFSSRFVRVLRFKADPISAFIFKTDPMTEKCKRGQVVRKSQRSSSCPGVSSHKPPAFSNATRTILLFYGDRYWSEHGSKIYQKSSFLNEF